MGRAMQGFSQAADNNKTAILAVLAQWLANDASVLEIGSGSGQHALHAAAAMPNVRWQPTERGEALATLTNNIATFGTANIPPPVALDLAIPQWPESPYDCVYSANVLHIVSATLGASLIQGSANTLHENGLLALYGPFKYQGEFTTPSNADFDLWLKERDPHSGVRDFEWVSSLANDAGLSLAADRAMPANNRLLMFRRRI